MSTVIDINERIIAQADEKLRKEIDAVFGQLLSLMQRGENYSATIRIGTAYSPSENETSFDAYPWRVIEALRTAAFSGNMNRSRQRAIDDFMRKVDSVQSQLDDLRDQVGGAQ